MEEFYKAWNFIQQHPKFMDEGSETFPYGLDIIVVKVNPVTQKIEEYDEELDPRDPNTEIQIWLEHGPYQKVKSFMDQNVPTHDIELDCGGGTFESAIINLAALIKKKYGDYESQEEKAQKSSRKKKR